MLEGIVKRVEEATANMVRGQDVFIKKISDIYENTLRAMESTSLHHAAAENTLMEDLLPRPLNTSEDLEEFNQKLEDPAMAKLVVGFTYL